MNGLRVIVGQEDNGPRSQLWRIWHGDNNSDVYVGARSVAGEVRVSLHESGKYRLAFTNKHQMRPDALIPLGADRAKHKWGRPAEFVPGLTRAFAIEIPAAELRTPKSPDPLKKPAMWLAPPPEGHQVEIDLFLALQMKPGSWPGQRALKTQLLYQAQLTNGEELVITAGYALTENSRAARIEAYKREALRGQAGVISEKVGPDVDMRGFLFNVPAPNAPLDVPCSFTDVSLPSLRDAGVEES